MNVPPAADGSEAEFDADADALLDAGLWDSEGLEFALLLDPEHPARAIARIAIRDPARNGLWRRAANVDM
ncbi:hypothetical protein J19TS2_63210 [Cohnella xylanilytica]|nr:hypothetical protein J19TS2_63210 [Cohnella xylanilytica]